MALADLKAANRLEPTNRNVLKELKGLRKALKQQKQADKDNYSGLFDRGEVCTDETDEKRKEREEARDALHSVLRAVLMRCSTSCISRLIDSIGVDVRETRSTNFHMMEPKPR